MTIYLSELKNWIWAQAKALAIRLSKPAQYDNIGPVWKDRIPRLWLTPNSNSSTHLGIKYHKRYMTLIETLLSAMLILFLATALMGFYRFALSTENAVQKLSQEAMQILYTRQQLAHVLSRAGAKMNKTTKNHPFWFYTSPTDPTALIFTYDAGAKADPLFSNTVLGKLFVDQNQLILLTWPTLPTARSPNPPMLTDILMQEIESIRWEFYHVAEQSKTELPIENQMDQQGWKTSWPIEKEKLPALIRMTMKQHQKKEAVFTFPLSYFKPPIKSSS